LKACESSSNSSPVWIWLRNRQLARGDGIGDVAQVLHRLDDHVAHDDERGDHRQDRVTMAVQIRMARLWMIALLVSVMGRSTTTGAGQVARLGEDGLAVVGLAHRVVIEVARLVGTMAADQAPRP